MLPNKSSFNLLYVSQRIFPYYSLALSLESLNLVTYLTTATFISQIKGFWELLMSTRRSMIVLSFRNDIYLNQGAHDFKDGNTSCYRKPQLGKTVLLYLMNFFISTYHLSVVSGLGPFPFQIKKSQVNGATTTSPSHPWYPTFLFCFFLSLFGLAIKVHGLA